MSARFRFSDEVRAELLGLFPRARPCLVLDLEDAVALYRGLSWRPIEWKRERRRLRQTRDAVRRLRLALGRIDPTIHANLPDPGPLSHLESELAVWLDAGRPGPRVPEDEKFLRSRFLHAFNLQGIRATRTRAGRFENAWRIVYRQATGRGLNQDLYRAMLKWPTILPGSRIRSFGVANLFDSVRRSAKVRKRDNFLRPFGI